VTDPAIALALPIELNVAKTIFPRGGYGRLAAALLIFRRHGEDQLDDIHSLASRFHGAVGKRVNTLLAMDSEVTSIAYE
jgi:hypothetical protein